MSRNQTLALIHTLTDPLWRKLRQRPPNSSFNAIHFQVLKHTVRERLVWVVSHTLDLVSFLFQQLQSSTCLRKMCCWMATYETPGLAQSATVRTANWLRHLPAPHRHVEDRCSDSGEPLKRKLPHTIPHHSQQMLPFRRSTRPFINNTRIDTPIAIMTSHDHLTGTSSADRVVS